MYGPINSVNGADAVHTFLDNQQQVTLGPDGLEVGPGADSSLYDGVRIPDRLRDWLVDLRLLRNIPLVYLVPDAALLPAESMRFFFVDPTWVARVIDGVFSAASTGTVDLVFTCTILAMSRKAIDAAVEAIAIEQVPACAWKASQPMTGMLIRSELTRRWPDMIVEAFQGATPVPVLRKEPVSRDILITLFAGVPDKVTVSEPFQGIRFGVEPTDVQNPPLWQPYQVDARDVHGENIPDPSNAQKPKRLTIPFRNSNSHRAIDLKAFSALGVEATPRQVALNLEQRPYRQEFLNTRPENRGSQDIPAGQDSLTMHDGKRVMKFDKLRKRLLQQVEGV